MLRAFVRIITVNRKTKDEKNNECKKKTTLKGFILFNFIYFKLYFKLSETIKIYQNFSI